MFKNYMLENYRSWFDFAVDQCGCEIEVSDLILVTGCDLTTQWAMAAFSTTDVRASASVGGQVPGAISAKFSLKGGWTTTRFVHHHWGPQPSRWMTKAPETPSSQPTDKLPDQCVFLRGYRVKERRFLGPKVIEAGAGPHDIGGYSPEDGNTKVYSTDSDSNEEVESLSDTPKDINLVLPLLDHLLEHSDSSVVIAHDEDIFPYIQSGVGVEGMRSALEKERPRITVEAGCGMLHESAQETLDFPLPSNLPLAMNDDISREDKCTIVIPPSAYSFPSHSHKVPPLPSLEREHRAVTFVGFVGTKDLVGRNEYAGFDALREAPGRPISHEKATLHDPQITLPLQPSSLASVESNYSTESSSSFDHKRRGSSHSICSDISAASNEPRRPREGGGDHIKPPENAFIPFLRKCREERENLLQQGEEAAGADGIQNERPRHTDLTKTIGLQWESLSPEELARLEDLTKEKKKEHEKMYPDYMYSPQRSKGGCKTSGKGGGTAYDDQVFAEEAVGVYSRCDPYILTSAILP
ncbi:hypothetical protein JAAARDRAFT_697179 [Jaapia argillacea MUCL 33604]|uniref:HMG box domain-containing protein n=1 Tax=Jaapia argillacea MUCL 33604 TaxID=933084 RepID=A0A067PSN4_9AGAM|nr:hypothetical protein JAAARDRAFT_697179 [Jaapia argillacea MUCL 33604]